MRKIFYYIAIIVLSFGVFTCCENNDTKQYCYEITASTTIEGITITESKSLWCSAGEIKSIKNEYKELFTMLGARDKDIKFTSKRTNHNESDCGCFLPESHCFEITTHFIVMGVKLTKIEYGWYSLEELVSYVKEIKENYEREYEVPVEVTCKLTSKDSSECFNQKDVTASGSCGDNLTWTIVKDTALIISGEGEMWDYIYNAPSIFSDAPWSNNKIITVYLAKNVTSIGNYAFCGCISLKSITIPNSITSIGYCAFMTCRSLTSVIIPNSVTSIGMGAFQSCDSLTSVTISNSITKIEDFSFNGCSSLTSIIIPSSVTSIGARAFADCSSLKSISIPNGVTNIEGETFLGCVSLTSISIPSSVTSIGNNAFLICKSLTSVTIPNSVTSIGRGAFSMCLSLTSITCLAQQPPTLGQDVFKRVDSNIPLYVPKGSESLYRTADGWNEFTNIIGIE